MRKMILSLIVAFSLITVGLIILLVYGLSNGGISFSFGPEMKLVKTESISLDGIDSINIEYSSENVDFYTSDTSELVFKEYMNYEPDDEELSQIETTGSSLTIKSGHRRFIFLIMSAPRSRRVEIYLPEGYTGELTVETSSGNIHSEQVLQLSQFTAISNSGNIKVNEVYACKITARSSSGNISFNVAEGNREISASSGNIKILGGSGDSVFHASSGNISVQNAAGYMEASAHSGEIYIDGFSCGGSFKSTSGNIHLAFSSVTEDLKAHSSSGNISLTLPTDSSFQFSADTSSGNIHTFFDDALDYNKKGNSAHGVIRENPAVTIELKASSGNIRVKD